MFPSGHARNKGLKQDGVGGVSPCGRSWNAGLRSSRRLAVDRAALGKHRTPALARVRGSCLCPRGDLNPHSPIGPLAPQASASTNSATRTRVVRISAARGETLANLTPRSIGGPAGPRLDSTDAARTCHHGMDEAPGKYEFPGASRWPSVMALVRSRSRPVTHRPHHRSAAVGVSLGPWDPFGSRSRSSEEVRGSFVCLPDTSRQGNFPTNSRKFLRPQGCPQNG